MKALVLNGKDQKLRIEEIPEPILSEGEALVRVKAAALNHRDAWIRMGRYANLKYPIVLGSDGAGIVEKVFSNQHNEWLNREVIINPSLDWGEAGTHQHPTQFRILGMPDDGTFADFVKVPVSNLAEKPAHLSFEEAAALPLAGLTAYRGLFTRGQLRAGEKVFITGIGGGVAAIALQFALAREAEVFVSSGSEQKIQEAISRGAAAGINYREEKWQEKILETTGPFDLIFDGTGGEGFNHLLHIAAPGGRLVLYGATMGKITEVEARRIFWKQLSILGTTMGTPRDFTEMTGLVKAHALRPPVDKIFSLEEGEEALQRMEKGNQSGKIILRIS